MCASLRVLSKPGGEVKASDCGEGLRELVGSGRTSLSGEEDRLSC